MKSSLIRTWSSGSLQLHSSFVPTSPRLYVPISGKFSGDKCSNSPRISLQLDVNHKPIRRVLSESDIKLSSSFGKLNTDISQSFPARIPEEKYVSDADEVVFGGIGSLILTETGLDRRNSTPANEYVFSGDGIGKGRVSGGGRGGNGFGTGGGNADRSKIGAYYKEMLKSDPTNTLLLRNYGKFLYEVEGDAEKAEEYYGRAILANPGDGEVLSLYGKLIWETEQDKDRAKCYFNQSVNASPDDCMVLGSFAQFMWEVEEDEEDEELDVKLLQVAMVEAF